MWLAGVIYTADAEAMALGNIGAVRLDMGELEGAERSLTLAIEADPLYGIPFYDLAVLAEVQGDRAEALRLLACAEERGYRRSGMDLLMQQASIAYAHIESRRSDASVEAS